jgi:hypothetical protein
MLNIKHLRNTLLSLAWNKLALSQDAKSVLGAIMTTPPTLTGVETPSEATIVCTGDAFTFKLNQALATYAEADGE